MGNTIDIKKYVGVAGDALVDIWRAIRTEDASPEAKPPVGAQDTFAKPGSLPSGLLGIPIGTLMLVGLAYFFLRK